MEAGKGSKPRNCFSQSFKKNYTQILWETKKRNKTNEKKINKTNNPRG